MSFLRPAYATGSERRADFWIGVAAWVVVDTIATISQARDVSMPGDRVGILVLANIVALVLLAFTRRLMAR